MCIKGDACLALVAVSLAVSTTPIPKANAQDSPISLTLAMTSANTGLTQEATTEETSSRHPELITDIESKMWPGFLTGLPGYEDFVMPVGFPCYFEDPFITTDVRLLYIYHKIPHRSVLRGGQVHVAAAQIRVALTERLAFIATKDGYSWVDSHITPSGSGWNDFAIGLKYAVHSDPDEHFLVSAGLHWEWINGSTRAWQGRDSHELAPFVAMAKGGRTGTSSGR